MNILKLLTLTTLIILYSNVANAQMQEKEYNYTSFSDFSAEVTDELLELIPDDYQDHPELGTTPYKAPCDNCYELVHKRTDSTKLYVEKGSKGKHYYSQATYGLVHYEENGYMMTYDPRLRPVGNGIYRSDKQDTPTFLNVNDQSSGYEFEEGVLNINNDLELILVYDDGSEVSMGVADWSDHTVGEEGIKITEAWEGIDMTITYGLDRIKTNYIIEEPLSYLNNVERLKFVDHIQIPEECSISEGEQEYIDSLGNRYGNYVIKNDEGVSKFDIHKAFGYDKSGIKERGRSFYYEYSSGLSLHVPASWITDTDAVYPLVIDPLVTSTATQSGGWMSFYYNGAWCGGAGYCGYNLSVPRPPNSTITGTVMDAFYESLGGYCFWSCYMSEAGFRVTSPCGYSPSGTYWNCNNNNPGTCSGAGIDVFSDIGACLGSACSGNVTFQMQTSYCYCSIGGGCGDNCQWMPNNTWSMTLEGHTVETLGNQTTGSGSTFIVPPSCSSNVLLDPNVQNGVPGYSYSWSVGGSSSTLSVDPFVYSGIPIVATVTDACGVTEIATFTISCPLSIGLSSFKADRWDDQVKTFWSMESEENVSQYTVERSTDAKNFEALGSVNPNQETQHYSYFDKRPEEGISYYRLKVIKGDEVYYSDVVSVLFEGAYPMRVIPNPVTENFKLQFNSTEKGKSEIVITDIRGNQVFSKGISTVKGINEINLNTNLKKGMYIISVNNGHQILKTRFIQQ